MFVKALPDNLPAALPQAFRAPLLLRQNGYNLPLKVSGDAHT